MGITVHVKSPTRGWLGEFSISHNYRDIAMFLDVYEMLWKSIEVDASTAEDKLKAALRKMVDNHTECWHLLYGRFGEVEDFAESLKGLHYLCMIHPDATLECYG